MSTHRRRETIDLNGVVDAFSSANRWSVEVDVPQGEVEANSVTALVRDLSQRLSGLAEEFDRRAAAVAATDRPTTDGVADQDTLLVRRAMAVMERRRKRSRFLPVELFHEPAWDMLLALFVAQHDRRTMNVKMLVSYAEAPATTSQRWIDHLHKLGLIDRVTDMIDRRRVEVQLSEAGDTAIRRYLQSIG